MTAVTAGKFDGAGTADLAGLHGKNFSNADGFHHRQRWVETTFGKRLNLLDSTLLHHLRKPLVNACICIRTRRHNRNGSDLSHKVALMRVGLPGTDRPPRGPHDAHRTNQPLAVAVR